MDRSYKIFFVLACLMFLASVGIAGKLWYAYTQRNTVHFTAVSPTPTIQTTSSTVNFGSQPTHNPTPIPMRSSTATQAPSPTPTPVETIVHNYSCESQIYTKYTIPMYPEKLMVTFPQITSLGNTIQDEISIQIANDNSNTIEWTLNSTHEMNADTISQGTKVTRFGIAISALKKSDHMQYAAKICSTWTTIIVT